MMMLGSDHSGNANSTTRRMIDADQSSNAHTTTFPFRLYQMLEEADKGGFGDIVSWLPDGNGFIVHDREQFTSQVMKTFFSHTKWKSFLRQLNLYNFERLSKRGPGQGSCYSHPCLIRGEVERCKQIHRSPARGGGPATMAMPTHPLFPISSIMEDMSFRQENHKKRAPMRNRPSTTYHSPSSEVDLKSRGISSISLFHSLMERAPFLNHHGDSGVVGIGNENNTERSSSKTRSTSSHDDGISLSDRAMLICEDHDQHDSTVIHFPQTIWPQDLLRDYDQHQHHSQQDDRGDHPKETTVTMDTFRRKRRGSSLVEAAAQWNNKNHSSYAHHDPSDESNHHPHPEHLHKDDTTHQQFCLDPFSSLQEEESSIICAAAVPAPRGLSCCSPTPILGDDGSNKNILARTMSISQALNCQNRLLLVDEYCNGTTFPDDIADAIVSVFGCRP